MGRLIEGSNLDPEIDRRLHGLTGASAARIEPLYHTTQVLIVEEMVMNDWI